MIDDCRGGYNLGMCGRYGLITGKDFGERFEVVNKTELPENITAAPGMILPVLVTQSPKRVEMKKWGLGYYKSFNARAESLVEKPSFRGLFKANRCLVPATGFWEWGIVEGKKKPYFFSLKDGTVFAMAGLFENDTYTIVTTTANKLVGKIHERMPVILHREDEETWADNHKFDTPRLMGLLKPYPEEEMKYEI